MSRLRIALLFCLLTLPALAQAPAETTSARDASLHFQAGLAAVRQGDMLLALREFQLAYAAQTHYSVLYNIGQARAALGQPVEAAAAFEEFLALGGAQINEAKRAEVSSLLGVMRKRVGHLVVTGTERDQARLFVDGVEIHSGGDNRIALAVGRHRVLLTSSRCEATTEEIDIGAERVSELKLPDARCEPTKAWVNVRCEVPDVAVRLDGVELARTPLSRPLPVAAKTGELSFSRAGYQTVVRRLTFVSSDHVTVSCGLQPLTDLPLASSAELVIAVDPHDSDIFLDGVRFRGGLVPMGRHRLRAERIGFLTEEREVMLRAGDRARHPLRLRPTRETERLRARSKTEGLLLFGGAALSLGAAATLYLWNGGRYDEWQHDQAQGRANLDLALSVQRVDDLALGLGVAGLALTAVGSYLYFDLD